MLALSASGYNVDLASQFRSMDKSGDRAVQTALQAQARSEIDRLLSDENRINWQVWVTYHNYYKAPDLIGPAVSAALNIPYVQIESTRAHKRFDGAWDGFARIAEQACDRAAIIFYLTQHDYESLHDYQTPTQKIVHLPPFLARDELPPRAGHHRTAGQLFCAGMMREGDKLSSYAIIANALRHSATENWSLVIAGDGPARARVQSLFQPFGNRVHFAGQLDPKAMQTAYETASLFVWPGVGEAFGVVYLEAQAAGLPIVAQDRPGVRDVVTGGILTDPHEATDFANAIDALLLDNARHAHLSDIGRTHVQNHHLLPSAARTLKQHIDPLIGARQ